MLALARLRDPPAGGRMSTPVKSATVDDQHIIRILQSAPAKMTSRQVAAIDGRRVDTINSRLSRMHAYGQIEREYHKTYDHVGRHARVSLWSARP